MAAPARRPGSQRGAAPRPASAIPAERAPPSAAPPSASPGVRPRPGPRVASASAPRGAGSEPGRGAAPPRPRGCGRGVSSGAGAGPPSGQGRRPGSRHPETGCGGAPCTRDAAAGAPASSRFVLPAPGEPRVRTGEPGNRPRVWGPPAATPLRRGWCWSRGRAGPDFLTPLGCHLLRAAHRLPVCAGRAPPLLSLVPAPRAGSGAVTSGPSSPALPARAAPFASVLPLGCSLSGRQGSPPSCGRVSFAAPKNPLGVPSLRAGVHSHPPCWHLREWGSCAMLGWGGLCFLPGAGDLCGGRSACLGVGPSVCPC